LGQTEDDSEAFDFREQKETSASTAKKQIAATKTIQNQTLGMLVAL
jgi:hypothetical protein